MMQFIMGLDWEAIIFCIPLLIWGIKSGYLS